MNLLKETLEIIKGKGHEENEILWVGNKNFKTTWENFKEIANINYDDGYGGAEVAQDILIVGDKFWLERHEYDGSEWWEYKQKPQEPEKRRTLKAVTAKQAKELGFGDFWGSISLSKINGVDREDKNA